MSREKSIFFVDEKKLKLLAESICLFDFQSLARSDTIKFLKNKKLNSIFAKFMMISNDNLIIFSVCFQNQFIVSFSKISSSINIDLNEKNPLHHSAAIFQKYRSKSIYNFWFHF